MKRLFTRKYLLPFFILISSAALFSNCNSSRRSISVEEGWDLLSEQKVNFVRDKDEIDINSSNDYTTLRFKVEGRDVHIEDLKVYFQNGDKLEPNIEATIPKDEFSRDIELGREGRSLDKIEFKYRTTGNVLKGRANVLVFGKRRYRNGY
ncbi:MAG: hypothetical protein ACJ749_06470 [Flavisolibacter sp.]